MDEQRFHALLRLARKPLGWAIASAVVGLAASASATPSAKLTYLRGAGAEQCPDESDLKKAVAARLGYDVFFPWARTTVVAEISRDSKGFHGRVKVVDDHALVRGERAIDSPSDDCGEVMRALALAISIAVDDFGLDDVPAPPSREKEDAPPPETPAQPKPVTPYLPPVVVSTTKPVSPASKSEGQTSSRGIEFAAWIAPMLSFGVAPAAAVGATADVEARYRFVSLGLEARGDLPASASAAVGGRVSTHLTTGSVAACWRAPAIVFACGLFSAGDFRESGIGIAAPHSDDALFAAAGGRIGVELPLGNHFFFIAHTDALAALTRHVVEIDGQNAFTIPAISASFGIGAGVRF